MKKFPPHESSSRRRKKENPQSHRPGVEIHFLQSQLGRNQKAAIAELEKGRKAVLQINATKAGVRSEQRAGFIFEEIHASTYNAAARKAGDYQTTARTGAAGRFNNDSRCDIRVSRKGKILREIQAKCYRNPGRTAVAISKPKYSGTDRLVPSDQSKAVHKALSKSGLSKLASPNARMRATGAARAEAASRVRDRISVRGHRSKPLSHEEVQRLASGDTSGLDRAITSEKILSGAKSGALAGGMMGGALSALSNTRAVFSGEKSVAAAAAATLEDTTKEALRGASLAVLTEGVKKAGGQILSQNAAAVVLKGSAPAAIAGCTIDLVCDAWKGELSGSKACKTVGRSASAWAGAEVGAALGAVAGPLGMIAGGVLGSILAGSGFSALFD
jgi:hypothetical protein